MELLIEVLFNSEMLNPVDIAGAGPKSHTVKQVRYVLHNRYRQRKPRAD